MARLETDKDMNLLIVDAGGSILRHIGDWNENASAFSLIELDGTMIVSVECGDLGHSLALLGLSRTTVFRVVPE